MHNLPGTYQLFYTREIIALRITELAKDVANWVEKACKETDQDPLAICVIRGGVFFFTDLLRALPFSFEPSFCRASSYSSSENTQTKEGVKISADTVEPKGRHVLIVDDICDSGETLCALSNYYLQRGAKEVKTAVLIKRNKEKEGFNPDWIAFNYPGPEWLVGYGMDDRNRFINLPGVYIVPV